MAQQPERLTRSSDRMVGGVASGIAGYFGIDPTVVRLLFVLGVFFGMGMAFLIYLVLWVVMPAASPGAAVSSSATQTARSDSAGMLIGAVLVIGGLLLLLNEFAVVRFMGWHMFRFSWPLLLIAIGGAILLLRRDRR